MIQKKKLYLVSREVYATNVKQALNKKGVVFAVSLAEEKLQPVDEKKITGFKKQNGK